MIERQQTSAHEGESDEFPRRRRFRGHWLHFLNIFLVMVCTMETTKRWLDPDDLLIQNGFVLAALWVVTAVVAFAARKRAPQWESLWEPFRKSGPWKDEESARRDWSRRWDE